MTIAIQRNSDGADTIFFDAVLSYSSTYNSRLTSHPIDGAGIVNDHVIAENPTFNVKGVISGADFNAGRPINSGFSFVNDNAIANPVQVGNTTDSMFDRAIDQIYPFGKSAEPQVTLEERSSQTMLMVKNLLISIRDHAELVTLVEFTNGMPVTTEPSLVIIGLQFSEEVDSGETLTVDLTLQHAKFVKLLTFQLPVTPANTSGATRDQSQSPVNKGMQAGLETKTVWQEIEDSLSKAASSLAGSMKNLDGQSLKKATQLLQQASDIPVP